MGGFLALGLDFLGQRLPVRKAPAQTPAGFFQRDPPGALAHSSLWKDMRRQTGFPDWIMEYGLLTVAGIPEYNHQSNFCHFGINRVYRSMEGQRR